MKATLNGRTWRTRLAGGAALALILLVAGCDGETQGANGNPTPDPTVATTSPTASSDPSTSASPPGTRAKDSGYLTTARRQDGQVHLSVDRVVITVSATDGPTIQNENPLVRDVTLVNAPVIQGTLEWAMFVGDSDGRVRYVPRTVDQLFAYVTQSRRHPLFDLQYDSAGQVVWLREHYLA